MSILAEILASLEAEECVMLATIIAARGSTPAAVASKMLVRSACTVPVGTIGGGCMEGEVIVRARRLFEKGAGAILSCDLNEEENPHGLICGGSVDVFIQPVSRADRAHFEDLRVLEARGEDCVTATLLADDGTVAGRAITHAAPLSAPVRWHRPEDLCSALADVPPGIAAMVAAVLRKGEPARVPLAGTTLLLEPWYAAPRLVVFGGGHVGRALCRAASAAGFRVSVADDRERYANPERFPEADRTMVIDFVDAAAGADIDDRTFVAIVTRGHAFDETVLEQVLRTPARYVGMIGSAKKVLAAVTHLYERGADLERLRRVHAPIGIEIGAVTAEEIAVSIVAQLIRVRRGRTTTAYDKSDDMKVLLQGLGPQQLIASR